MMSRWQFLIWVLFLVGCAQEKRLGESFIESRRYSRGWHVNAHRNAPSHTPENASENASESALAVFDRSPSADAFVTASSVDAVEVAMEVARRDEPEWALLSFKPAEQREAKFTRPRRMQPKSAALHARALPPAVLLTSELLPEPIAGRHPDSVPGFVLALGWFFGIVGEMAVNYLGMPLTGVSVILGILASVGGYVLCRKAYRASLEHPDLYPRYRLARAGRIIAISPLLPIAIYAAIIVVFVLLLSALF